jgi:hypothetical protein
MSDFEEALAMQRMAKQGNEDAEAAKAPKAKITAKPTTADMVRKAADVLGGTDVNSLASSLSDPRLAGAVLGGAYGLYKSGASLNPIKPYFLQSNPRYSGITPPPRPTFTPPPPTTPVYGTATGQASTAGKTAAENMFTNQVANKSFAQAGEGRIANLAEHGITGPTSAQMYAHTGPTEVVMIGGKPMEIPLGAANNLHTPEIPIQQEGQISRTMGSLEKSFPGLKTAGQWIKGALPTLKEMSHKAGVVGAAADVGSRAMEGDYTGAGISGLGTVAGMLAAPEIGIPAAVGSMGVNYLRDHPEIMKNFFEKSKRQEIPQNDFTQQMYGP